MTKPPLEPVPITRVADEMLIERLEVILEEAKAGEIASIFYLRIRPNGNWTPSWAGKQQDKLLMIGILEGLKWELLNAEEGEAT